MSLPICFKCEGLGELICCDGPCMQSFHYECLPEEQRPNNEEDSWICNTCSSRLTLCASCHQIGNIDDLKFRKCSNTKCGLFYHWECVTAQEFVKIINYDRMSFKCPRHFCHECAQDVSSSDSKVYRCIRCPAVNHGKCLSLDVTLLEYQLMCCGLHPEPLETTPVLLDSELTSGDEYSEDSTEEISSNKLKVAAWGSFCCIDNDKPIDFALRRSLVSRVVKSKQLSKLSTIEGIKPPTFKLIRTNIYTCTPVKVEFSQPCDCNPDNPCLDDCYNRSCYIECNPKTCPAGKLCQNQRFQKRQYSPTHLIYAGNRGFGMASAAPIKEGDLIIEYCGEIINEQQARERLFEMKNRNEHNFYLFNVAPQMTIDAGPKGSMARFINHSCGPNCETQKWMVRGRFRIGIFAKQDIPEGVELTYDYKFENYFNPGEETPCLCGAPTCSGFLGMKPKKVAH